MRPNIAWQCQKDFLAGNRQTLYYVVPWYEYRREQSHGQSQKAKTIAASHACMETFSNPVVLNLIHVGQKDCAVLAHVCGCIIRGTTNSLWKPQHAAVHHYSWTSWCMNILARGFIASALFEPGIRIYSQSAESTPLIKWCYCSI